MTRLTRKLATALLGLGALAGTITEAHACPGGGGGGRGFGGGFHRPAYHSQPRYVQPAPQPYYHQPAYQQPSYGQPSYGQPAGGYGDPSFGQPAPQIAAQPRANMAPTGLPPTVKKLAAARPSGAANPQFAQRPQFAAQQPDQSQFAPQQQAGPQLRSQQFASSQPRQSLASQPSGQPAPRSLAGGQVSANPLQALGGSPMTEPEVSSPQSQPQPRPQMARRPQPQAAQPQQSQEETSPMDQAQLSALAALGGIESEQPQQSEEPSEQPQQTEAFEEEAQPVQVNRTSSTRPANRSTHVGNWIAQLQNGSKVQLTLQADGSFSWVATSGEKVSSFEGNYTLSGGSLTLVRSSDNQKLIGSMTPSGASSFTFKLTGTKDAGLNFSRS